MSIFRLHIACLIAEEGNIDNIKVASWGEELLVSYGDDYNPTGLTIKQESPDTST